MLTLPLLMVYAYGFTYIKYMEGYTDVPPMGSTLHTYQSSTLIPMLHDQLSRHHTPYGQRDTVVRYSL